MNRLMIVLVLIVAGVAGLGFYRGWFHLTSEGGADRSSVTVTVDKGKVQEDKQDAREKVQRLGHDVKDKSVVPAESK